MSFGRDIPCGVQGIYIYLFVCEQSEHISHLAGQDISRLLKNISLLPIGKNIAKGCVMQPFIFAVHPGLPQMRGENAP